MCSGRAVYSNVLGFLGGVAWAICVARVCQLFPNAAPALVVTKFFAIIASWPWSADKPILLKDIIDRRWRFRVWNPKVSQSFLFHNYVFRFIHIFILCIHSLYSFFVLGTLYLDSNVHSAYFNILIFYALLF
jgi:hypothetical protein